MGGWGSLPNQSKISSSTPPPVKIPSLLPYHFCFNFILFGHTDHVNFDFNWYSVFTAVFSFEKGSNRQNHFSSGSGSYHLVKSPPLQQNFWIWGDFKNVEVSKMVCLINNHEAQQEVSHEIKSQRLLTDQSTVFQNSHLSKMFPSNSLS